MYYKFYPRFFKLLLSVTILMIVSLQVSAQSRPSAGMNSEGDFSHGKSGGSDKDGGDGWSLALNAGYESPLGDLKYTYKGAPTFGLTVALKKSHLVYSATVDYRSYKPKQDTVLYSYDNENVVTVKYSNFSGVGLYLGVAYDLELTDKLKIYGGLNGGFVLTSYKITLKDIDVQNTLESATNSSAYIGPKGGFSFLVSNNVGIGLEARYSLGVVGANYNTRDGGSVTKAFNSYAGNVFLTYRF